MKKSVRDWLIMISLIMVFSSLILGAAGCMGGLLGKAPSINPGDSAKPVIKIVEKMNWFMPLLIMGGVGGGVFSFVMGGHRMGLKIIADTLATVSLTLGVMQFMWQFAFVGFIAGIGLLAYCIYINRKAMILTIGGVERLKEQHPELKSEINGALAGEHGEDVNVLSIIKHGKLKLRKKAAKLAKKAKDKIGDIID